MLRQNEGGRLLGFRVGCEAVTFDDTKAKLILIAVFSCGSICRRYSCLGYYKFVNDDTGAKPPYLDDYEIEIIECDSNSPAGDCSLQCYTGAACGAAPSALLFASLFILSTLIS